MGVEANLELQNAARKVLRENYRLRELLRLRGVDEDEVESYLRGLGDEHDADGVYEVERSLEPRSCSGLGGECCEPGGSCGVDNEGMEMSDPNVVSGPFV